MEKFSVKKPFTVLVAVVMVLVLGFVSVTRMTTDLLPEMSLPYMIVITTYPGASSEKVEAGVTEPMESALGTISGVKNVLSVSNENYGLVELEFEDGTDMDSAMVKVSSAVEKARANLPEGAGTPSIMEISMDMMATMYVAVSREGYDIYELSDYVNNTVRPFLERQDGVASISDVGLVEQSIQVELDGAKIDALNEKLLESVNSSLADAKKELDSAEKKVKDGKAALEKTQGTFGETLSSALFGQLSGTVNATAATLKVQVDELAVKVAALRTEVTDGETGEALDAISGSLAALSAQLEDGDMTFEKLVAIAGQLGTIHEKLSVILEKLGAALEQQLAAAGVTGGDGQSVDVGETLRKAIDEVKASLEGVSGTAASVPSLLTGLESAYAGMTQAQLEAAVGFSTGQTQLAAAEAQLKTAREQYDAAKESALKSANLDQLLSVATLSKLIYAQNFSMPAGYIDDADDNAWLLKVGDEFQSVDELSGALLCSMDALGDVTLGDVATVTVIDNAEDSYARMNGEQAVILCIYKGSTAGTNEVAENCLAAFDELEQKYEGTKVVTLVNQGEYITMIVNSVLSSMIIGAALAILILAIFLKDLKPTLVVGISIPLSVLAAIVLMYFTGISLNMMSLSGLALGIGMLVDNSIVVIENIYRLRSRGISAARAAVQGTKQVTGSIVASTLTTICVFLPLVFTTGTVRELLMPMGLCIGYCLTASLVVALTVVPATASTLLRNTKPKNHPLFDKVQELYGASLDWCLRFKLVPLAVATGLLAFCVWRVANMGIVMIPPMTSDQIQVSMSTPEEMTREQSYAMADKVTDAILSVENVQEVGVMDSGSSSGMMSGMATVSSGGYIFYVSVSENAGSAEIDRAVADINAATADLDCTVEASANGMGDITSMLSSGLSVNVYGDNIDTLQKVSEDVMQLVGEVEGFENPSNGFEDGDATVHLVIDRDKAMSYGLTVAQLYAEVAGRLTTSAASTTVTVGGVEMSVTVADNTDPLTLENLMDIEFETTQMDATGQSTTETHTLGEFATRENTTTAASIRRENQTRYVTVTADTAEGYNTTLLSRTLQTKLDAYSDSDALPEGYSVSMGGESSEVNKMVSQMLLMMLLGLVFIYLVMVAQFQSLLSPFIVLFTIPLAFTGGLIGLMVIGQQLSLLSLMGFLVLMGTVVNNGIVFVDYTNQLRIGGMQRRAALIATGKTRMRPIFMTALTTILAMMQLIMGDDMGSQLGSGMAVVVASGLAYATLMTLYIVPVMYDIFFKRPPLVVDVGGENIDDIPDDAAEFIAEAMEKERAQNWPGEPDEPAGENDSPAPADKETEDGHDAQ